MLKSHLSPWLADAVVALERRYGVIGLRHRLLAMLAGWIAYFLFVKMFVQAFNKVAVPVLGLPLGFVLPMQGAIVIFVIALCILARQRRAITMHSGRR